jgi:hypothetical protein
MIKKMDLLTEKTLRPGEPGTKKWIEKYGDSLICIRYKYDRDRKMKVKTVELVAEEKIHNCTKTRVPSNKIVYVRIRYGEVHYASMVKGSGGKWNPEKKLWEVPYGAVKTLGLTHRIVR